MIRLNVIELTDDERDALAAAAYDEDGPEHYRDLLAARAKLSPAADTPVTLIALRRIAEGTGAAACRAREALEAIGDRVSADAPEGSPDAATVRARDHADAQGGGDFG